MTSRPHVFSSGLRRLDGFTLAEALVGLAVFALILLLLLAGLRSAGQGWQAVERHAARADELRLASGFLRRTLSRTVPLTYGELEDDDYPYFEGEERRIRFAAGLPAHRGGGGLYLIELERDAAQRMLRMRYHPVLLEADGLPASAEEETVALIDEVRSIEFAYYGLTSDGELRWQERWVERVALPLLVRLRVVPAEGAPWPELVVPLPALHRSGEPQWLVRLPEE